MAKGFSKNNPLDKLSSASIPKSTQIEEASSSVVESEKTKQEPKQEKQKRKVGRPKTKDIKNTCKNINVAVPIVLLDKWEEIKIVHGNNLTEYITKLIEKDMNTNYERYKDIINSFKNI